MVEVSGNSGELPPEAASRLSAGLGAILDAAKDMDWQQVALNRTYGAPCFHVGDDGFFCGRAKRWDGHGFDHDFISLADLLLMVVSDETERCRRAICNHLDTHEIDHLEGPELDATVRRVLESA